jgi:thiamine biosynthesis lipoprotein
MDLFQHKFASMGCPCEIQLYANSRDSVLAAFEQAESEVHRLDRKYSHYREDSELQRIRKKAVRSGGVKVDRETAALLDYAQTQYELSGGLFDISAGALTALWDRITHLPDQQQIHLALAQTGWRRLNWDGEHLKMPAGLSLDLGGVVKEYAADRAAGILQAMGFESGYTDLGGDLHFIGPHPDGSRWRTGIRHPGSGQQTIATIEVQSGGLASSGDYERYSVIDGERYGHIINPLTGWPVSGLAGVSVLAPSCLVAGSLATLAMLAGVDDGLSLLRESGLPWLAIHKDFRVEGTLQRGPRLVEV